MKRPVCPLCGSDDNEKCFPVKDYELYVCHLCQLFFIDPYPKDLAQRHETVAESSFSDIETLDSLKHYRHECRYYQRYFPLIAEECKDAASVLDVGCGTGRLLELLGQYPQLFRAGIELNAARAQLAGKNAGCEIHRVPLEVFSSERKFEVVTLMNVLSHIVSFDQLFGAIRSLLSENGKLIIKVGEFPREIRRTDSYDWGVPHHLHFLGLDTLEFICRKYGFTIGKHRRVPLSQELFTFARFTTPGRSRLRNAIKWTCAHIPFALPLLRRLYDMRHSIQLYSSFIVLNIENR